MPTTWTLEVSGTELTLLPEKAIHWKEERTLLVADMHVGKDATFRARAVPVPLGSTASDLERLGRLLQQTGAERLIILGDLYHANEGMTQATRGALRDWRAQHQSVSVVLVRGNHDRDAVRSPPELDITEREEALVHSPFVFRHTPEPSPGGYVVGGHVHPGVVLRGDGGRRERLPCFHVTPSSLVVPAFSEFTGLQTVEPNPDDEIVAVAGDALLSLPADHLRSS